MGLFDFLTNHSRLATAALLTSAVSCAAVGTDAVPAREIGLQAAALGAPESLPPLPWRGTSTDGQDLGRVDLGVIYGASIGWNPRGTPITSAINLAYYLPSEPDNQYREGDVAQTHLIGDSTAAFEPWTLCPAGYGAVGLHGSSGLLVDKLGLICGNIDDPKQTIDLPAAGDDEGGLGFHDVCTEDGLLTGIQAFATGWFDRLQGLCRRQ